MNEQATEKQIKYIKRLLSENRNYIQRTYSRSSQSTIERQMKESAHSVYLFEIAEISDTITKSDASKLIDTLANIYFDTAPTAIIRAGIANLLGQAVADYIAFIQNTIANQQQWNSPAEMVEAYKATLR